MNTNDYLHVGNKKAKRAFVLAVIGIIIFILIAFTFPFKQKRLSTLYQKKSSDAAEELTDKLLQAADPSLNTATGPPNTIDEKEVIDIAQQRKTAMIAQASTNPTGFLHNSLPSSVVSTLPEKAQSYIEHEKEVTGTLLVFHSDNFKSQTSQYVYELQDKNSSSEYTLNFAQEPQIESGSTVSAKGVGIDNQIVLEKASQSKEDTGYTLQTLAAQPLAPGGTVDHKLAVFLINFTDNRATPFTPAQTRTAIFDDPSSSVNSFYKETSGNRVSFSGDVFGWYNLPISSTDCTISLSSGIGTMISEADKIATSQGVSLGNYTHQMFIFPDNSHCNFLGVGTMGGPDPGYTLMNGTTDLHATAHEIGHNLGLNHSSTLSCGTKQIDILSNCSSVEYGDAYDIMGISYQANKFNSSHYAALNWLTPNSIQTVTNSGTYTISRLATSGTQILKIAKPKGADEATQSYYYVSLRAPTGRDSTLPAALTTGSSIHLWDENPTSFTKFIDSTPNGNFADAPIQDGTSFSDPGGFSITQASHNATSATLNVNFTNAPTCTKAKPTLRVDSTNYPENPSGTAGSSASYNWEITNHDSAGCASSSFKITASLESGWTSTVPIDPVSVAANGQATGTLTVTSSSQAVTGNYTLSFTVTDQADASRTANASATFIVIPSTTPTVKVTAPNGGETLESGTTSKITWESTNVTRVTISYINSAKQSAGIIADYDGTVKFYNWTVPSVGSSSSFTLHITGVSETGLQTSDDSNASFTIVASSKVAVDSLDPISGGAGIDVTIFGKNFGKDKGKVFFGAIESPYIFSWSSGSIHSAVPTGAISGKVKVVTSDSKEAISTADFSVTTSSSITVTSPTKTDTLTAGTVYTIKWSSTNVAKVSLYSRIDPDTIKWITDAPVANTSSYNWTVDLTPAAAKKYKVTVVGVGADLKELTRVESEDFTVIEKPSITSFTPPGGYVNDTVTIIGKGFGVAKGSVAFSFGSKTTPNGIESVASSWEDSKIITSVPENFETGKILLTTQAGIQIQSSTNFEKKTDIVIKSITPTTSDAGTNSTIEGFGFSTSGSVTFSYGSTTYPDGKIASQVSYSPTKIVVKAPYGVPNGKVKVQVGVISGVSKSNSIVNLPEGAKVQKAIPTTTSATISWQVSDTTTKSYVEYGPSSAYGFSTTLLDNTGTTNSVVLANLRKCTNYKYRFVTIYPGGTIPATGVTDEFTTGGCENSHKVVSNNSTKVEKDSGGSLNLVDSKSKGVTLDIPANVTDKDLDFQINKLDKTSFTQEVKPPADKSIVGDGVYNFAALSDPATTVSSFDNEITVTFSYDSSELTNINENSLSISRWDGSSWTALSGCVIDKNAKLVHCKTKNFSDFVLVGDPVTPSPSASGSPSPSVSSSPSPSASNSPSPSNSPVGGPPAAKEGDVNNDGKVNIVDLSILLRKWNKTVDISDADLNKDGKVTLLDLSILLRRWGK